MFDQTTDQSRDRAVRLFEYFKALIKMRSTAVRDTDQYVDIVWLADIPMEEGCYCAGWPDTKDASDGIWVAIKKQTFPRIPALPEKCESWIDHESLKNFNSLPVLKEKVLNPKWKEVTDDAELLADTNVPREPTPQFFELADFPEVISEWQTYVEKSWKPWADAYKKKKAIQNIYARLFSMHQQQKALGESYEVILGLGLLNWVTANDNKVSRHIVTAQVLIDFDANRGAICVKPSAEGAMLQFETDMLEINERPIIQHQRSLEDGIKDIGSEIWNNANFEGILRSWVQSLNANGQYADSWGHERALNSDPYVSFSPALILRKRTTRGYLRFVDGIINDVKNVKKRIPRSVELYTEIKEAQPKEQVHNPFPDHSRAADDSSVSPVHTMADDSRIHFPLSANDEQLDIIKKLGSNLGVLVQGPPGTGKSHTIANLICHLLSQGKKILITSQTARALKVLMNKLPAEIRPLCVNLLGQGLSDIQSMEACIGRINQKHNNWNHHDSQERIENTTKELEATEKDIAELRLRFRELRETETRKFTVAGSYSGTAQQISAKLCEEEERYGWLQDDCAGERPFKAEQLLRLLNLRRALTPAKLETLLKKRPVSTALPSLERFIEMVQTRKLYEARVDELRNQKDAALMLTELKKYSAEQRDELLRLLTEFRVAKKEALRRNLPWLSKAVDQMLSEQDLPLKELEKTTAELLDGLIEKARNCDKSSVLWPSSMDLYKIKADAEDLCAFLLRGGKLGWGFLRHPCVKQNFYLTKEVIVDGRPCNTAEALQKLIETIGAELRLRQLEAAWEGMQPKPNGTRFHRTAIYHEQRDALHIVLKLEDYSKRLNDFISSLHGFLPLPLNDEVELNRLCASLESLKLIDNSNLINKAFDELNKTLSVTSVAGDHNSEVLSLLFAAVKDSDYRKWGQAIESLKSLEKTAEELVEFQQLIADFKVVLPNTAKEFEDSPVLDVWEERFGSFDLAWNWSVAENWLNSYLQTHDEYDLQKSLEFKHSRAVLLTERLAAEKAWNCFFKRLTEKHRRHLMAWSVAIKKLGKGTGKYAEHHRRTAEENLRECQDAIPAWIMPLYRVVDTVRPEPEMFDVVIVDEASQCGTEALILQYIAKQCIIVGDEEQIAPESVGIDRQSVNTLIEQFLFDVPIKESFDVDSSLFTHAKIRFANKIVLREHFRSVPEIIQFSNNLCYAPHGTSLIPLRHSEPIRLEPIRTTHVREGYREGHGQYVINKPEAERLVEQVIICAKDKKYAGKNFGVISLQGQAQSKYIEKRLIEELGAEIMEEKNIICGEPYDFQGDERNVLFISMVAAANEGIRIGQLAKETDKRRFNVAASRAADQCWLFHSVTLEDLSPNDLRHQLLSYYLNPQVATVEFNGIEIDKLRTMRRTAQPPLPFESWFEVDVFLRLHDKGYRVLPQFQVANYRIDLVVEGLRGRLAVECDGDAWHGADRYEADAARQRILERAKWVFWRIRGSAFYRDPTQSLDPLWQQLEEMGIHPRRATSTAQVAVVEPEVSPAIIPPSQVAPEPPQECLDKKAGALTAFAAIKDNEKKLTTAIAKEALIKILSGEPTKGRDLILDEAVKLLGYTCRRAERKKLQKKIDRVISDLIREGTVEQYSTDKRQRIRLVKPSLFI